MSLRHHLRRRRGRHVHYSSAVSAMKIGALSVALMSLIALGIAMYTRAVTEFVRTDRVTLCPVERRPSEVTVLLLDMSDTFTAAQQLQISNALDRITTKTQRFGLIEVYRVEANGHAMATPLLRICNPGTGRELNKFYQNPELAGKKWADFAQRLNSELRRLMAIPPAPASPIFEAVQATAFKTFNHLGYDDVPKRLVIVSDLMQNVPGKLSHYTRIPRFDEFRLSRYFTEVRSDLGGVAITVLYLVREPRQPWPGHYQFWEQYFATQGATIELLQPIYGAR